MPFGKLLTLEPKSPPAIRLAYELVCGYLYNLGLSEKDKSINLYSYFIMSDF